MDIHILLNLTKNSKEITIALKEGGELAIILVFDLEIGIVSKMRI